MAVSFTYNKPSWWLPRSYIKGLSILGNLDVLVVNEDGILMHRALFDVTFFLGWKYDFFPASSNGFALGTLFSTVTSYATVFGVPAAGGVLVSVFNDVNDHEWFIKVQAYAETTPVTEVLLPAMPAGYWYPYSS